MSQLPFYIQQAADLGLLDIEDGRVVGCRKDEVETVMGITRIIEKIQPTTIAKSESTVDQESIVLCRVLSAPSGAARELWSNLRIAFGVGHGQNLPENLWSTPVLKAIGNEIDQTFLGNRNAAVISRESLTSQYENLANCNHSISFQEFAKTVAEFAAPETMRAYGDASSEWDTALDILRQSRVRALYKETLHVAEQVSRSDSKLEKNIEFLQSRAMECLGMLRGSIGNQGAAIDIVEDLLGNDGQGGFIDQLMQARAMDKPVSTGIPAMDLDMEAGILRPSNVAAGGRLFCLAARTGIGKTQLGVWTAANAVCGGLTAGFISAELDKSAINSRLWAAITKCLAKDPMNGIKPILSGWISSPSPDLELRERVASTMMQAAGIIQERGGKLLVEAPWGADVDAVVNTMRSMKARNPDLRYVVLDHFHCLSRHRNAPSNEASMMEERAYKLMTAAKELDIDLLVLAQMNRVGLDAVSRKQPPQLNEIRGTDALSHVCHAVWIVRKALTEEGVEKGPHKLELWHVKNRGRQATWNHANKQVEGIRNFIDCSGLELDHATSSVQSDDTGEHTKYS
jgi:hypothetical protein